jgi:signal transduction histidine kinase
MYPVAPSLACALPVTLPDDAAEDCATHPVFLIDVGAKVLLEANPAGIRALGLDAETAALPLAIDAGMPALRCLRDALVDPQRPCEAKLTFWFGGRAVELACRIERPDVQGSIVRVRALSALSQPGGATSTARRLGPPGADLDVALDAWLAHELRTPLSAVIAYAEVLKSEHFGPLANPRYQTYARDIYESARHALGVVDSMLRGDRARSAVPPLAFADVDPARVVESCLTVARPLAERAGLALSAECAPGLPRVVADEVSLRQMLLNLLSNAIKFARPGDRVSVTAACEADGPLTIAVADTGPGMDDAPKADPVGLGLGLPLTRALAAANGATLTIESARGRGTRVTLSFAKDRLVPV